MATEEAKAIYRRRCAIAEWANAQARMHGVSQFNVRGLAKVTSRNAPCRRGPQLFEMEGPCGVREQRLEELG